MKTREQMLDAVKAGKKPGCIDGRDFARLVAFFPVSEWVHFGFSLTEGAEPPAPEDLTEGNVLKHLTSDLEFGFEKALNQRGISASLMYEVVKMWLWVLDDPLKDFGEYAQYGLPLFKAVAIKYNLPNPIGDDSGSEEKYAADGD